jgi:hypothetical protein
MTDQISRTPGAATQPVIFFQAVADHFSSITPNRKLIMNSPFPFKRTRIAALMAVALFATGAWAQERAPAPIDVPFQAAEPAPGARGGLVEAPIEGGEMKGGKVERLGCCECLGQSRQLDLSTGLAAWTVKPPTGPAVMAAVIGSPHTAWTSAAPAKWINEDGTISSKAAGLWKYKLRVLVPKCVIPFMRPLKLSGTVSSDNSVKVTITNSVGTNVPVVSNPSLWSFQTMTPFSVALQPGMNTVTVEVTNEGGPTGMALNAVLDARCVKENSDHGGGHLPVEPLN